MAQRRSVEVAVAYAVALSPGVRANCWSLAEAAGHEGWGRMRACCGRMRGTGGTCGRNCRAWPQPGCPGRDGDLIGPGIAIDETAQPKKGGATACVALQHAGCTGKAENCVTTVFSAFVTAAGQARADFDVYMPERWAGDLPRRRAAGIPRRAGVHHEAAVRDRPGQAADGGRAARGGATRCTAAAATCARPARRSGWRSHSLLPAETALDVMNWQLLML